MLFFVGKKISMRITNLLPDNRLKERGALFMSRMIEKRSCVVRQISMNWKEEMGFWRYLKNPKVSLDWLIESSLAPIKTGEVMKGRHLLSIQDSTTIGFKAAVGRKKGLQTVGALGNCPGFILHPNLLIDAHDGRCLGLGDVSLCNQWVLQGDSAQQRHIEASEKKTGRWLASGKAVRNSFQDAQMITHVADRESDFYEMLYEFGQHQQANEHLIVRVKDERLLGHMEGRGKAKNGGKADEKVLTGNGVEITFSYRSSLSSLVEKLPIQAQWVLNLPATPKRVARKANVALRYASQVPLRRPMKLYKRTYQGKPLPFFIYMNVIDLVEILPPQATYPPIHWRLYTSHPLQNIQQAQQVVQWYCWRWKIELLFATVKSSGLNLEFALVDYGDKLKKLAILVLMAAIQTIQLLQARDGESQQDMLNCFSEQEVELIQKLNPSLEGNTQKQKNPHPKESLAFATWVIARLGGWKGYKSHRPPGIKTISRGLIIFSQIKRATQYFNYDNSV
jgi:hypothetical protein